MIKMDELCREHTFLLASTKWHTTQNRCNLIIKRWNIPFIKWVASFHRRFTLRCWCVCVCVFVSRSLPNQDRVRTTHTIEFELFHLFSERYRWGRNIPLKKNAPRRFYGKAYFRHMPNCARTYHCCRYSTTFSIESMWNMNFSVWMNNQIRALLPLFYMLKWISRRIHATHSKPINLLLGCSLSFDQVNFLVCIQSGGTF